MKKTASRCAQMRHNINVLAICEQITNALGHPYILKDHKWYSSFDIKPEEFTNSLDFYKTYQSFKLLSKSTFLKIGDGTQRELAAYKSFIEAEVQCRTTNQRLRSGSLTPDAHTIMTMASRKIANVLRVDFEGAPLEPFDLLQTQFRYGPGSFYGGSTKSTIIEKTNPDFYECTKLALPLIDRLIGDRTIADHCVCVVEGSRLATVPKTAKTDRTIGVEPGLNIPLQKQVGAFLRRRLKNFNIDLDTQEFNQAAAKVALERGLATVDLKAASDTISHNLVMELLPIDWYVYLDSIRSHSIEVDRVVYPLEKFSAMGNGFTFELETMLFWAIAQSCIDFVGNRTTIFDEDDKSKPLTQVLVYGDDIILSADVAPFLISILQELGFTTNKDKTYLSGRFYESCGHDFFDGHFVRPVYIKDKVVTIKDTYNLYNKIIRMYDRLCSLGETNVELLRIARVVLKSIPNDMRFWGPIHFGDSVLHEPTDVVDKRRTLLYCKDYMRFRQRGLVSIPKVTRRPAHIHFVHYLLQFSEEFIPYNRVLNTFYEYKEPSGNSYYVGEAESIILSMRSGDRCKRGLIG